MTGERRWSVMGGDRLGRAPAGAERHEPDAAPPTPGRRTARPWRRLPVGLIGLVGCGVTTALIASGVMAAGGGVFGGPRIAVSAASVLVALLVWRTLRRRHRAHDPKGASNHDAPGRRGQPGPDTRAGPAPTPPTTSRRFRP